MKFVGLASLMLAACLGANTASAAFIGIDDYSSDVLAGRTETGNASVSGGLAFAGSDTSTITYALGNVDYSLASQIKLARFNITSASSDVVASVRLTDSNNNTATRTIDLSNSLGGNVGTFPGKSSQNLYFDFTGEMVADLSDITELRIRFSDEDGIFAAQFTSLHAVPEPTSLALIGLASAGGLLGARRRRKAAKV